MKLSVSLSEDDVRALDEFVRANRLPSRSAGVQRAVRGLRHESLVDDYAQAFTEWQRSGDADDWDRVASDGLDDAPR